MRLLPGWFGRLFDGKMRRVENIVKGVLHSHLSSWGLAVVALGRGGCLERTWNRSEHVGFGLKGFLQAAIVGANKGFGRGVGPVARLPRVGHDQRSKQEKGWRDDIGATMKDGKQISNRLVQNVMGEEFLQIDRGTAKGGQSGRWRKKRPPTPPTVNFHSINSGPTMWTE